MAHDRTPPLQQWMQQAGFSSFRALSQATGISEKQIRRIRRGEVSHLRLEMLQRLSQSLQVSLPELLAALVESAPRQEASSDLATLKQEYDRLQARFDQQQRELWQEFQQSSVQILESLLLQLPTAVYAAQQNPQVPAVKLLPLLRPLDRLLEEWGIEAIAGVGSEIPYDPQQHQLMEGTAQTGESVRVRYTGYRQGDKLLYRAKVSLAGKG